MTSKYVFDTYAIFEILGGNDSYERFSDSEVVINNFIFAELCYGLFRVKEPKANDYISRYSKFIFSVKPEWIEKAMQFRLQWKDRKVSMTDCVSYIMAKEMGLRFLTGDKEFEDLENVEFVK